MHTRLPILLAVCLIALTACGGEETSGGSGTAGGSPSDPATASGGDAVEVEMKDILFIPERITVRAGQTVRWTNKDTVAHTVKATKGADFESKSVSKGKTFEVKITKAGTIDYVCTIHPSQTGQITATQ